MSNGPFAIAYDSDGKVVFVENACPDDLITAEIYDQHKDFAYANLLDLIEPSLLRDANPPCKLHKICGSCQWQHISYKEQLKFKQQNLVETLLKNGLDCPVPDLVGMDNPWHYRNKITYPVKTVKATGRLQAGYFKRNSNELINIKYCPIQYDIFDTIMDTAKELCSEHGVTDEVLRHILLRSNQDHSQVLLCFIVRKSKFIRAAKHAILKVLEILAQEFAQIRTVTINYNDGSTNVILGSETEIIKGEGYIVENFGELKLQISTNSFFQVNTQQFLKIIDLIKQHVSNRQPKAIIDLYCGIGTISLSLAQGLASACVIGVEEVTSAVDNALINAKLNNIQDAQFVCSRVEDYCSGEFNIDPSDLVIINPPRKGCTNRVLDALGASSAQELIYVSCNPATLARDIQYLTKFGFALSSVQAVDMFPHSFHFETLAFIKRHGA